MEQNQTPENNNFFWIVCIITTLGASFWSISSLLQQPRPLFIAFTVINAIALVTNIVCFVLDKRKK